MATPDVLQTTSSMSDNFTICGICQETFKRPKVLNCLHTFCYGCLNEHISKEIGPTKHRHFACPSCDMDIEVPSLAADGHYADNIQDDQFMEKLVELKNAVKDDKNCDICSRRDENVAAINWCMDCNDALCELCSNMHLHVKVTSSHSLTSLEEMRTMPLEVLMRKKNKIQCSRHEEFITLFCVDCKDPLCVQCMAVSHRRCENVVTVNDAMTSRSDIDNVLDRLQILQNNVDSVDGLAKTEKVLEETIESARHEIKYLSNSLCAKIRDQEQFLLKKLDTKAADAREVLKGKTEPRKLHVKSIKSASHRMNNLVKYGSELEILMEFNKIKKQIDDYDREVGQINPEKLQVSIEFIPDESSLTYLDNMRSLGDIAINTGADDGVSSWGVTCTLMDDIIVTDCKNKRIQKFSKGGDLVDHIQLDDEPRDITTCVDGCDVAVPVIGRLIIFIATRWSLTLIKKTKTERQYDGISYSDIESYLIVSSLRDRSVDIIQLDGEVLKSISLDRNGEPMFAIPRYVAASIDRTIVVSDIGLHSVKCIDIGGSVLFSYSGQGDLKVPQGVCVDKIGNIFIADNSHDRIQLLTSNGAFQRYVLVKDSGIERPCAMMVSSSNRLIIVQNDGMVKVYSYS